MREVQNYLSEVFSISWIGGTGTVLWPLRHSDISVLDFFMREPFRTVYFRSYEKVEEVAGEAFMGIVLNWRKTCSQKAF